LRAAGLSVVFTTSVVRRSMRVGEVDPTLPAERLLEQLLEPHGLLAEPGPGDTWVVRRVDQRPEPGVLLGELRSRHSGRPVALGTVFLTRQGDSAQEAEGVELRTLSNGGGVFRFDNLPPGRHALRVSAEGFADQILEVMVAPGVSTRRRIDLQPQPFLDEEIAVRSSQQSLLQTDPTTPLALSRSEIESLPHLAGDAFRTLPLLPGVAAGDLTARPRVHGGRADEVQILLDGQELYETYHLQDFDSGISLVPASFLESAHFQSGGFGAERGDRMSGVLDLTTRQPSTLETRLSFSLLTAEAASGGAFGGSGPVTGSWYGSGRLGSIALANRLFGQEDPAFWDLFGKLDLSLGARHQLRLRSLQAGDRLEFSATIDGDSKGINTLYETGYTWLTHQAIVGDALLLQTTLSTSAIDRDRRGFEDEVEQNFDVTDLRKVRVHGLRQEWTWAARPAQTTRWGAELRTLEAEFDYRKDSLRTYQFASSEVETTLPDNALKLGLEGSHLGGWASQRFGLAERWFFELGLRADRHQLAEFEDLVGPGPAVLVPHERSDYNETFVSPRFSVAYGVGAHSVLRASWGYYHQTHRPYELQVENGESSLARSERAEHSVLSYEHSFSRAPAGPLRALRAELYLRDIDSPRPRFENLFEPFNVFREVEGDRILIAPDEARAYGLELSLRGAAGSQGAWLLNYALARSEDRLPAPSGRWIPRDVDQEHTLNLSWSFHPRPRWSVNLAGRFHSGWPTTPTLGVLASETPEDGPLVVQLGPLRSERLGLYHRLDLRVARRFDARRGEVHLFLDVQNLANRKNPSGFDYFVDDGELQRNAETWPGILPSVGISWTF
jgi:hypothetical protein